MSYHFIDGAPHLNKPLPPDGVVGRSRARLRVTGGDPPARRPA